MTHPTLAYPYAAVVEAAGFIPELDDLAACVHLDDIADSLSEAIDKAERRGAMSPATAIILRDVYALAG